MKLNETWKEIDEKQSFTVSFHREEKVRAVEESGDDEAVGVVTITLGKVSLKCPRWRGSDDREQSSF